MFGFLRIGRVAALFIMLSGAFGMQPAISAPVTAHDFTFENIEGAGTLSLADFAGQPIPLVNTASCGFAHPNMKPCRRREQYRDRGVSGAGRAAGISAIRNMTVRPRPLNFCEVTMRYRFSHDRAAGHSGGDAAHPLLPVGGSCRAAARRRAGISTNI